MSKLIVIGFLLVAATAVVGTLSFQDKAKIKELEKSNDRGKLEWYAAMAKAKGEEQITFRSEIRLYTVPRSLDEALRKYNVVIVEPVETKSFSKVQEIQTWYKFKILEELSSPIDAYCDSCPPIPNAPEEMLPLKPGEFVAAKSGGELLVDGIKVISYDPDFPAFHKNRRYLLFLSLDAEKMVGALRMGPWGTYHLTDDRKLEAVDKRLKHQIKEEITNHLNDSLDGLKVHIREKVKRR